MSTTQSAPSSPTQARTKKSSIVTDQPKFDLESYIGNYQGRTKFDRLFLIGVHSSFLGVEALKLAVRDAKAGRDTQRFTEARAQLSERAPQEPEAAKDNAWVERTEKQNNAETHRLEAELKGYKNNLIKESIRMGNEDLGKHYQAIGDLPRAMEAFNRMRQDISVSKHIVDVGKHLIEVAIEQRSYMVVSANIQKIRNILSPSDEDKSIQPFVSAAEGLAHMDSGSYYDAAIAFLQAEAGMGISCNTIISPNDIAIYGGLCALATMDRGELQSRILENSSFRTYLELEPHIRRAITFFVNSRYSACLSILEAYSADYALDIHLHSHIEEIYYLVRSKSIVQYFIPFSCVTLDSLNEAFAPPGKTIDKELVTMIQRKILDARIDTQNRLLTSVPSAPRASVQNDALMTAKSYEREARRRIQHMNIAAADLEVKGKRNNQLGPVDDLFDNQLRNRSGYR